MGLWGSFADTFANRVNSLGADPTTLRNLVPTIAHAIPHQGMFGHIGQELAQRLTQKFTPQIPPVAPAVQHGSMDLPVAPYSEMPTGPMHYFHDPQVPRMGGPSFDIGFGAGWQHKSPFTLANMQPQQMAQMPSSGYGSSMGQMRPRVPWMR